MPKLPGWRYFRNLLLLIASAIVCLFGISFTYRAPIHLLWVLPLAYLAYLFWVTFSFTHPRRLRYWDLSGPVQASPDCEKVLFKSRDGLTLFGWFLPGHNRAAIILAHTISGSGIVMEVFASFLVNAGYNALLVDLRAHGSSDGDTSTYGVLEAYDIAGAVDYLLSRGDIDPDKIGVLGISLGAQAALRGALQCNAISALVLEGLGPADIQDRIIPAGDRKQAGAPLKLVRKIRYWITLLQQWAFNLFSGTHPTPLIHEISKIAPRPILLVACGDYEIDFNRRLCAAGQASCTLWELPKAQHAAALAYAPQEYQRRIVEFFDHALQSRPETRSE